MAMDWGAVTESHVRTACEMLGERVGARKRKSGLVLYIGERSLPVKHVLRHAYRLAKGLAPDAEVEFASGEASLNLLRRLGFRVERVGSHSQTMSKS